MKLTFLWLTQPASNVLPNHLSFPSTDISHFAVGNFRKVSETTVDFVLNPPFLSLFAHVPSMHSK